MCCNWRKLKLTQMKISLIFFILSYSCSCINNSDYKKVLNDVINFPLFYSTSIEMKNYYRKNDEIRFQHWMDLYSDLNIFFVPSDKLFLFLSVLQKGIFLIKITSRRNFIFWKLMQQQSAKAKISFLYPSPS